MADATGDVYFPDGTKLSAIIANLNVFATNPSASKGEGEIIYNSTDNKVYVNTGTTTTPTWVEIGTGSGGWVGAATSNLDMNSYDIIDCDKIKAPASTDMTFEVNTGQAFVFSKV